jgi:hypothetical protein
MSELEMKEKKPWVFGLVKIYLMEKVFDLREVVN